MEVLIGFTLCIVFFLCLGIAFYFGYKFGMKHKEPMTIEEKEQQKAILMQEGFSNIMNYDVNKAMERRLRDE